MDTVDNQFENPIEPMETKTNSKFSPADQELMSQACSYLYSISKWMKFFFVLMIIQIVCMALGAIISLVISPMASRIADVPDIPQFSMTFVAVLYLIFAALDVIPAIYLKRIYTAADRAIESNDNEAMVEFLKNNKSFWKFAGILVIVMLAFCIFVLPVVFMIAGLSAL